ncbi:MAG: preprotein translocase subunit YajC [Gallionella sp.]
MFISNAYAEGSAAAAGGGLMDYLPLVALVAVFYFLVLRPQQKRAKEHQAMMTALQKGDEVATSGGLVGRVTKVYEDYASVEVSEGMEVKVQKSAILTVLPKGTISAIK